MHILPFGFAEQFQPFHRGWRRKATTWQTADVAFWRQLLFLIKKIINSALGRFMTSYFSGERVKHLLEASTNTRDTILPLGTIRYMNVLITGHNYLLFQI